MRKVVLWEYRRGSWQYDVMVAIILMFIFLTPRTIFRDQPRANNIVMLPTHDSDSAVQFWVEPELLQGVGESDRVQKTNQLLKQRTGKPYRVTRLEPIFDAEQAIQGFVAYATR